MTALAIGSDDIGLDGWRKIYRGAAVRLHPDALPKIAARAPRPSRPSLRAASRLTASIRSSESWPPSASKQPISKRCNETSFCRTRPALGHHLKGDERVQDPYCLRCQPQVMGAVLDLLRHAAGVLVTEPNGATDNPLIFPETGEALSGGNFHGEPIAFAADMIAIAICEIGSLAERRIAMLIDPAVSGPTAFLTAHPGLNSGFMIPQVTAAALVAENRQWAHPASIDTIPTSANQEDHASMSAHAARRLIPMADNLANIIGVELLAAAQGCDFHRPLASSPPLERVRERLRAEVPFLDEDRSFAPDIAKAAGLVQSGAVIETAGQELLPLIG